MKFSLNEIDALCKKAVRGAGFEWGYAEEAGKALRWLAMYDLPGAKTLATYLTILDVHKDSFQLPNTLAEQILKADDGTSYCPILTGAWLCDRASIDLPNTLNIENLSQPLLLLPYLAFIARDQQKSFEYKFSGKYFAYADQQLKLINGSFISENSTKTVAITFSDCAVTANRGIDFEQYIDEQDWQVLNRLASRTYVPASKLSRQGAGSEEDSVR